MPEDQGCAIVTGASRGFGLAISQELADAGWPVVMAARDEERLGAASWLVRQRGADVLAIPADVADEDAVERLVGGAVEAFGSVGVLVNNAGAPPLLARLGELTWDEWRRHIDVDMRGVFNGCRTVLPLLLAQGRGTIVNVASGAISAVSPHHVAYTPANLAILGLSRCIASETASHGVFVHCVCPDITPEGDVGRIAIETFAAERGMGAEEWLQRFGPKPPSSAAAVAESVVALVGEASGVWHAGGDGLRVWDAIAAPPRDRSPAAQAS